MIHEYTEGVSLTDFRNRNENATSGSDLIC